MSTAKLFTNGKSQAVRLPKEYRFPGDDVGITRVGEMVVLYQKTRAWSIFSDTPPVTDDFCESILEARQNDPQPQRDEL
jgi:antitoxin VapB